MLWISLLGAIAILIGGLYSEHLFSTSNWFPEGIRRFLRFTVLFWAFSALIFAVARRYYVVAIGCIALLCTTYAVGFAPVLTIALIVAAAAILGRRLFQGDWVLLFLTGMAIFAFAIALVARAPVHYPVAYLVILLSILIYRPAFSYRSISVPTPQSSVTAPTAYWGLCLMLYLLTAHWLVVLKPEAGADALSMHLAIAFDMATRHAFTLDFPQFVWALMPMGADFCYALAHILGGEYAARLLNLVMLTCIACFIYRAVRAWLPQGTAFLVSALFLSSPMVQLVTGTMMVENFVAAMALGSAIALWRFHEQPQTSTLLICSLLLGTAIGWKIGAITLAVTLVPTLILSIVRNRNRLSRPRLSIALAVLLFLVPAVLPYATAYVRSGNPIYPFANNTFHSPYLDEVLEDPRFREPLNALTLFRITFQTNRYYEGQPGSFGFQYLLLIPFCLVAFPRMRSLSERSAVITGMVSAILVANSTPNARYFYPATAFLTIGFGAALARARQADARVYRVAIASIIAVIALNLCFLPAANYYHRDFVPKPVFSKRVQSEYRDYVAPIRRVIDFVNSKGSAVMFTQTSEFAGATVPVYLNHWHNFSFNKRVQACRRPADIHRLASSLNIRYFIAPEKHDPFVIETAPALMKYLELCGEKAFQAGDFSAIAIAADCEAKLRSADPTYADDVLTKGSYDDMDTRIGYTGEWHSRPSMEGAYQRTLTYSAKPGDETRIRFSGRSIVYTFTKAPNRGSARIEVDGADSGNSRSV